MLLNRGTNADYSEPTTQQSVFFPHYSDLSQYHPHSNVKAENYFLRLLARHGHKLYHKGT